MRNEVFVTRRGRFVHGVRRHGPSALIDGVVVILSYLSAMFLRFEGAAPPERVLQLVLLLPPLVALHVSFNMMAEVYRRNWRYATVEDAWRVMPPVGAATLVPLALALTLQDHRPVPASVFLIASLPAYLGMVGVRLWPTRFGERWRRVLPGLRDHRERVLVVGAGRAAHQLIQEMERHDRGYVPVGIVSDEPGTAKLRVGGVRVLGRTDDLVTLIDAVRANIVALAIPEAPRAEVRRIVECCLATDVRIRFTPDLQGALDGGADPEGLLRTVRAEDFLGRQPADADVESCRSYVAGKSILITGAAGSIGSELARQVRRLEPSLLALLDINESGLFDLAQELYEEDAAAPLRLLVRNIEDTRAVEATFCLGFDVVFHAAAYKHVSLMEDQPEQAIVTNVLGTRNLVSAARSHGVERFVFVSSDKAVAPSTAMGASKRIGEAIVHGMGGGAMATAAVRFGNVLGSRGSVLPIFERQIRRGGPVTVTDPDVRRYFMTIPEAVMLVIQAGALTRGSETFVLRMGDEIRIVDLAHKLIRLRGHRVGSDIRIEYTGLQPGEKLAEELLNADEELCPTEHPDIALVRGPAPSPSAVEGALVRLGAAVAQGSPAVAREALFSEADAAFAPQNGTILAEPAEQPATW